MNVTWITQAGLVFENEKMTVMVDPYLSNSVAETLDPAKERRIPVDESIFDIHPDVIIITHEHLDHLDPDTLKRFLCRGGKPITVLAPGISSTTVVPPGKRKLNALAVSSGMLIYILKALMNSPS